VILLDTHVVIWLAESPEQLSSVAHTAIVVERQADGLAISDKTLWELAHLISSGKVVVKTSVLAFLRTVERNFMVLPVTSAIAERSIRFSSEYPKDPADRLIGATAVIHGLRLLTKDEAMRRSGEVDCVW
jgi:PIN domain nuclease of toxin-antitoxin system